MDEEQNNITSTNKIDLDESELSLRPEKISEYIGQTPIKEKLIIYIKAALERQEPLDHVLLFGPPGLGKTTLSRIIANELGVNIKTTSGPAIEKTGELVALLNSLENGDVLFIDEIHRLPKVVEEILYSAMEDYRVDIVVGQGTSSNSISLDIPAFTLVGATTQAGMLSAPLRDRFGIVERLEYYQIDELELIAKRSAEIFDFSITDEGAHELALRSRGTPRITNRLLKRVRDFAQVAGKTKIDEPIVKSALDQLGVDQSGLDDTDIKFLRALIEQYNGGPTGLQAVAASIGESSETLEEMVEPYLLQAGFLQRTRNGRVATPAAYEHLKINHQKDIL